MFHDYEQQRSLDIKDSEELEIKDVTEFNKDINNNYPSADANIPICEQIPCFSLKHLDIYTAPEWILQKI